MVPHLLNLYRSRLMVTLCTDILLWLSAVTEDTIHMEIELERQFKETNRTEIGIVNLLI